jgi:subtilisin family serine protease
MAKPVLILFMMILAALNINAADASSDYLLEWKEDGESINIAHAKNLLAEKGIIIDSDAWIAAIPEELIIKLRRTNAFEYIEKSTTIPLEKKTPKSFNIQKFLSPWTSTWHLEKLDYLKAWRITEGSADITVAVCDSGINATLPEFIGKILPGHNFIDNDSDTSPNTNHGTAVSSYIAAEYNSSNGFSGIAPGVRILPGKIVNKKYGVPQKAMLGCIRWAADQGAKVINVSMTGVNSRSSASAARYANKKGSIVVWAAGNQNMHTKWKDKFEIIAVGGTDIDNKRYQSGSKYGSNTGPFVDIVAPGEDVYHLNRDGSYGRGNGTSYSAPIVAGVAALIYSLNPNFTPREVLGFLNKGATNLNNPEYFGSGLVNAHRSLVLAKASLK